MIFHIRIKNMKAIFLALFIKKNFNLISLLNNNPLSQRENLNRITSNFLNKSKNNSNSNLNTKYKNNSIDPSTFNTNPIN